MSKIAQENMEVFVDVWEAQVEELGKVLRLITAGGDPSKSKCARECILIVVILCKLQKFREFEPLVTTSDDEKSDGHSFR